MTSAATFKTSLIGTTPGASLTHSSAACCLAVGIRERGYLEEAGRWKKPELESFGQAIEALVPEMEDKPFEDVLGGYYTEFTLSSKGQQRSGEFHTPKHIRDLMARMTLGDADSLPVKGPITVCEPACGAGSMILSLAQACSPEVRRRLRVTAIDVSRAACDMTFINTTLWGIPTRIIRGDSLAMKWWAAWSNIHYIAPWLPYALRPQTPEAAEQGQPPKPVEVERIEASLAQREFAF